MKKVLNLGLLISFIVTMMAPLTGVYIHKLASLLFLVFSIFHVSVYGRRMNRWRVFDDNSCNCICNRNTWYDTGPIFCDTGIS